MKNYYGFKGLLPLLTCSLHKVHNGFHKGILVIGVTASQLAFELHFWFKISPCKQEDFRLLADSTTIEDESLFLRHVNTRWLTLVPALEKKLERWEDAKKYFLIYLPNVEEYKSTLPKNQKYKNIAAALKDENVTLVQIKFLIGVAPIFRKYLLLFQDDAPLVHILFIEMKTLLLTLMKRFMKGAAVNGKSGIELLTVNVNDPESHIPLKDMDIGAETAKQLLKIPSSKRAEFQAKMKDTYIQMTLYLQKNLPLDSTFLRDLRCLGATWRREDWTVEAIKRIASALPHIVGGREISYVLDAWKMLQLEDIPEDWSLNSDGSFKRIDHYYAKVLDIRSETGDLKYKELAPVVKTCLSIRNGNASCERSLSDNKNMLTAERTNLSEETIMGLRRAKGHCREMKGAHNVDTREKKVLTAMQSAHSVYEQRKEEK